MSVLKFSNGKQHIFSVQINAVTKIPRTSEIVVCNDTRFVVDTVSYEYYGAQLKVLKSITIKLIELKQKLAKNQ